MKRVIIFHEHHGIVLYDISTDDHLCAVALHVVRERFGRHNDYYPLDQVDEPVVPTFTLETAEKLSDGPVKRAAIGELESYDDRMRHYMDEKTTRDMIARCLETNDAELAWKVLRRRQSFEDEGFTINKVNEIQP